MSNVLFYTWYNDVMQRFITICGNIKLDIRIFLQCLVINNQRSCLLESMGFLKVNMLNFDDLFHNIFIASPKHFY